ncbi:MAG: hypothetical protein ACKV2Q_02580 [Planctomycetaceae bacterium]
MTIDDLSESLMGRKLDPITRLVRQCDPNEALSSTDPRFVDFADARGADAVKIIERQLRRAGETPERLLFAGHLGIGKSSLLKRLQDRLETGADSSGKFTVVWIDTTKQLDPNDLDFPDLLVLIAAEVQRRLKVKEVSGFTEPSIRMKSLWDACKELIGSTVRLTEAEIDVPFGSLTLELRNQPTARTKLREQIEKLSTELLSALNELLHDSNAALRKSGGAGLVLIVDGLEKMSRRELPDGSNSHDRLFIHRSAQLASLEANVVYTVPISLYYSPQCSVLEQAFGEFNTPVPMIKVRPSQSEEVNPNSVGMQRLWEMLDLRCKAADVPFADVFPDDSVWQHLCAMSGGHPRHLLMLLRTAANQLDALPITLAAAEQAVRTYANSLLREIPDDFWPKLRQFELPQEEIPRDEMHQKMLYFLHVFEYQNGRPWYEVNPVIRTLERFRDA